MSFKRERASPNGGRLATEIINFHRPNQVTPTVVPSVNAVFFVNGCIGELPV